MRFTSFFDGGGWGRFFIGSSYIHANVRFVEAKRSISICSFFTRFLKIVKVAIFAGSAAHLYTALSIRVRTRNCLFHASTVNNASERAFFFQLLLWCWTWEKLIFQKCSKHTSFWMFLAVLKAGLKKVSAETVICRRIWKWSFLLFCCSCRPHGSVLGFFKCVLLCMTSLCGSFILASLENVRFIEAERLILCLSSCTPLRCSLKKWRVRAPKWSQTMFFDAVGEIGPFGGLPVFPSDALLKP